MELLSLQVGEVLAEIGQVSWRDDLAERGENDRVLPRLVRLIHPVERLHRRGEPGVIPGLVSCPAVACAGQGGADGDSRWSKRCLIAGTGPPCRADGHPVTDGELVRAVTQAARRLGRSPRELDAAIWERAALGTRS